MNRLSDEENRRELVDQLREEMNSQIEKMTDRIKNRFQQRNPSKADRKKRP